jgi:hypothetical protein
VSLPRKERPHEVIAGLFGLFALAMGGAAAAALAAKQRIVPIDDPEADEVASSRSSPRSCSTAPRRRSAAARSTAGTAAGSSTCATRRSTRPAAHLEVKAVFGGAQILVPASWRVESSVSGVGAAQDMRPKTDRPVTAPLLTLSGLAVFGGVGVSSEVEEDVVEEVTEAVAASKRAKAEAAAAVDGMVAEGSPSA